MWRRMVCWHIATYGLFWYISRKLCWKKLKIHTVFGDQIFFLLNLFCFYNYFNQQREIRLIYFSFLFVFTNFHLFVFFYCFTKNIFHFNLCWNAQFQWQNIKQKKMNLSIIVLEEFSSRTLWFYILAKHIKNCIW